MATAARDWKSEEFSLLSNELFGLLKKPDSSGLINATLQDYSSKYQLDDIEKLCFDIIENIIKADHIAVLADYEILRSRLYPEDYSFMPYLFSILWFESQLALPRSENPVSRLTHKNYMNNIKSLRKVNPELADLVSKAAPCESFRIVQYWDGLYFFDLQKISVLKMADNVRDNLAENVSQRVSIAIDGINSGQEIIYCLRNNFKGIHGMARAHFVLEEDVSKVRAFLELFDCSAYIENDELILLFGPDRFEHFQNIMVSNKYPIPSVRLEYERSIEIACNSAIARINELDPSVKIKQYYQSPEFRLRLQQIAAGQIKPRILVSTCLWTTFLKHCAADFQRSFASLGCQTKYLIEESNTQTLSVFRQNMIISDFLPDIYFMISHARPSVPFLPEHLPVVCYLQDRCGPLMAENDLSQCISTSDLFICQASFFTKFLTSRKVSPDQFIVMPVPVDENIITPLTDIPPDAGRFRAEVAFVKHMAGSIDSVWQGYKDNYKNQFCQMPDGIRVVFNNLLDDLYKRSTLFGPEHLTEDELIVIFKKFFETYTDRDDTLFLAQNIAINFIVSVATTTWRYEFVRRFASENIDLALYGANWDKYPEVARFARGPVNGKEQLRKAYNLAKINLHINNVTTMHQRLVESALAGGFIITANIPTEKDWEPASNYFTPGKELILADSPDHMVDLCKYYLTHEDERLQIAQAMRNRALESLTLNKGAEKVLSAIRDRLIKVIS